MALGLGPIKDAIQPSLAPVGAAQMAHQIQPQGIQPNAPVIEAPTVNGPGGPARVAPGLPPGKFNPVQGAGGAVGMDPFRVAMIRKLAASGADPGNGNVGRPQQLPGGAAPENPAMDLRALLGSMLASRNSRRVMGAMQGK